MSFKVGQRFESKVVLGLEMLVMEVEENGRVAWLKVHPMDLRQRGSRSVYDRFVNNWVLIPQANDNPMQGRQSSHLG